MRVFITGATGFIGPALATNLIARGHEVVGLARSEASAKALRDVGVSSLSGSLTDLAVLRQGAAEADGVIHLAYSFSPGDMPRRRLLGAVLGGWPGNMIARMMRAITMTNDAALDALAGALRNASNRYRAGYSAYIDQLDAQRGLLTAELSLVQARADRLTAYVTLYQAMGGGWSRAEADRVRR